MGDEKSSKLRNLTKSVVISVSFREVMTVLSQHGLERQGTLADIGHT